MLTANDFYIDPEANELVPNAGVDYAFTPDYPPLVDLIPAVPSTWLVEPDADGSYVLPFNFPLPANCGCGLMLHERRVDDFTDTGVRTVSLLYADARDLRGWPSLGTATRCHDVIVVPLDGVESSLIYPGTCRDHGIVTP